MAGTISFDGLATGIKTSDTVDKLIAVESRPKILKEAEKVRVENQLASWREINSRLLAVKVAASDLARLATWNTQSVASSREEALTATAALGAPEGTYTLRVETLARAHQVATSADPAGVPPDPGYARADSLFGTGTLKLSVGSLEHTFTLNDTNHTLAGVAKAINEAKVGVSAAVVHNGSGYQLLLTGGKTGTENALALDASGVDTTGTRPLGSWTTVQAAQDAVIALGSGAGAIRVTSASNTVSTLLQGVTLNLKAADVSQDVTVSVSRNTSGLAEKAQAFVDAYNEATTYIKDQFAYDSDKKVAGILMGDGTLLAVQRSLNSLLLRGVDRTSAFKSLSSVGITLGDTGSLSFNTAKFSDATRADFEGVMRLMRTGGDSSHPKVSFVFAGAKAQAGAHAVNVTAPATRASAAAAAAASLTVGAANETLTLAVDGRAPVTVKLKHGTYTADTLAAEVQAKINATSAAKVAVTAADGRLSISSERYGAGSRLQLLGGSALTNAGVDGNLGLGVVTATGADVAGTIGGEAATGTGQLLRGNAGNPTTDGMQVLVQAEAPTTAVVTVTKGLFSQLDEYLSGLTNPLSGASSRREEALTKSVASLQARMEEMDARLATRRESLLRQFLQMEKAVGQFNSQGNYLSNALSGLSNNWKWNG